MADLDVLDRAAVARLLGVRPGTISFYLAVSRAGGIYEQHPFPEPDGRVGNRAPFWVATRAEEIQKWEATRPRGRGGRPKNG